MAELEIRRKNTFMLFREAKQLGPYAEFPMLRPEIDPQLHLSRNDRSQPFHLICGKDTVLVHLSGSGAVEFRGASINHFDLEPGDHVYVPAGTPHRVTIDVEAVQYRFKAADPGAEGVAWFCEECDEEIYREVWNASELLPQLGYEAGCAAFNADASRRRCGACGREHDPIDTAPFGWRAIAELLIRDAEAEPV